MKNFVWGQTGEKNDESTGAGNGGNNTEIVVNDNNIYFYQDVMPDTILNLKRNIISVNNNFKKLQNQFGSGLDLRIKLHIQSNGGDIVSGLNILDFIKSNEFKIDTYVEGMSASAGTLLSMAGDKRYITKNSYLLLHQIRGMFWGKHSDMTDQVYNWDSFINKILDFYVDNSKLNREMLENILKDEKYIDANLALEYGLVDKII